ncbi:MAG TPA: 50S ribosomal protein L11 methyltransferase [Rhodospirillales bacterium]|jgi:ribosomal protein L11 methyltransferase|nr:50S ribosomal protein L11 methyltransferase [Rhodospirillales bacterium]HIL75630.1 50S ribosomal protein L11 methyltransferase [Rhodospirillales bacterium]
MVQSLYQILFEVSHEHAPAFAESLEPHLDSVSWTAQEGLLMSQVSGISNIIPDECAINITVRYTAEAIGELSPKVNLLKIPIRNWVLDNLKKFPPITVGRFFVHGAEYDKPLPHALISLCIPAATAFGTGDHGSTKGCLVALDRINYAFRSRRISSALDMGCGSGILAIAIAKRWCIPVIATDIDPISTRVSSINAKTNGVSGYVRCLCGSGYNHRKIITRRFDIIVSNILLRPLTRLAKDLGSHLNPGGWAILSGLLSGDANRIISAHAWQGLRLVDRINIGDWQTLIFRNSNEKK